MKINWESSKTWGVIGVILFLLGVIITVSLEKELRQGAVGLLLQNGSTVVSLSLALVLLGLTTRFWRENKSLRKRLVVTEPNVVEEVTRFKRFENIDRIIYGHIGYRPLLYYDPLTEEPEGVGITLLEMIFGTERIVRSDNREVWSDLLENLVSNQYDIVATPLFETRERSQQIAFCSPMFYSDIGLYVRKGSGVLGKFPENSLTFKEATEILASMKPRVVTIEGEISGKMALKYLGLRKDEIKKWLKPEKSNVTSLISAVSSETGSSCEIAFAEVFQAGQTDPVKGGVIINVLKPKEILYPVSFAVRKSDYILKNYINIKLLEIEERVPDGVLSIVLNELRKHSQYKHYDLDDIKKYFVRELDEPYSDEGVRCRGNSPEPSHEGESHDATPVPLDNRRQPEATKRQIDAEISMDPSDAYA